MALQGLGAISPEAGLEAFAYLLSQEASQVAVLPINWPRFRQQSSLARAPHFFAMIEAEEKQTTLESSPRDFFHQLDQLEETSKDERSLIETHTQALVSRVLGLRGYRETRRPWPSPPCPLSQLSRSGGGVLRAKI